MGSGIELNDTLQITTAQGFPADLLNLERHLDRPITIEEVSGKIFQFSGKDGARVFHLAPVRVYLVHSLDGKWLHWGHAYIQSQTISRKSSDEAMRADGLVAWQTSGTFVITDIYDPQYQRLFTMRESPAGRSYY